MQPPAFTNTWPGSRGSYPRRSRLAFLTARLCHGATIDVRLGRLFRGINRLAESRQAAAFSRTIRLYSAGVQDPFAIRAVRWAMVAHDASASSVSMKGTGVGDLRRRFFITERWSRTTGRPRVLTKRFGDPRAKETVAAAKRCILLMFGNHPVTGGHR
jgi:hypothetical protein